jgi:hypothetical protein
VETITKCYYHAGRPSTIEFLSAPKLRRNVKQGNFLRTVVKKSLKFQYFGSIFDGMESAYDYNSVHKPNVFFPLLHPDPRWR